MINNMSFTNELSYKVQIGYWSGWETGLASYYQFEVLPGATIPVHSTHFDIISEEEEKMGAVKPYDGNVNYWFYPYWGEDLSMRVKYNKEESKWVLYIGPIDE